MNDADYISRPEFLAHIEPMREDIREMRGDVKTLLANSNVYAGVEKQETKRRGWLQTIPTIAAGVISALVTLVSTGHTPH